MMTPLKISRSGSRRSGSIEVVSVPYLGASNAYNSSRYFRDVILIDPHEALKKFTIKNLISSGYFWKAVAASNRPGTFRNIGT